jgi:hypothetical protein
MCALSAAVTQTHNEIALRRPKPRAAKARSLFRANVLAQRVRARRIINSSEDAQFYFVDINVETLSPYR